MTTQAFTSYTLALISVLGAGSSIGFPFYRIMTMIENKSGWSSNTGDLLVSADGKVSGSVVAHPYRQSFDGFVSEGRFDLKVEQELLEKTKVGAFPPGTKFIFNYTFRREVDENANTTVAPEERNSDLQCKRTVWRMRNVANLSGGSMIAIQVPECVKW